MVKNVGLIAGVIGCAAAGCVPVSDGIYTQISQNPRGNFWASPSYYAEGVPARADPYSRNPWLNTPRTFEDRAQERYLWKENAHASPLIFSNPATVSRHIREETRGANFYDSRDRAHAHDRALQIKERAWNNQVRQWNRQLESQGYTRKRIR